MSSKQDKRKKKKMYYQSNKKQRTGVLVAGLKGFIITCNNEQQCVKESYNLLNEFADDIFGPEIKVTKKCSGDSDIEDELAKEIESIKCKKRRFQQVCTMVKNVLFIATTVPDPTKLVTAIFEKILQTKQRKARYILRMNPIIITCKVSETDIRKHLDEHLEVFTKEESNKKISYKTDSKIRHNTSVNSDHIIWYVREAIEKCAPEWTVNLTEPDLVICVYVLRSICCIGLLKNFVKYRKYNLSETAIISEKSSHSVSIYPDTLTTETDVVNRDKKSETIITPEKFSDSVSIEPDPPTSKTNLDRKSETTIMSENFSNSVPLDPDVLTKISDAANL